MINISNLLISAPTYDNKGAHEQLKGMMARKERLSIYFSIDNAGYEFAKIESKTVSGFKYRLNQESFDWIMGYLIHGKTDNDKVNPIDLQQAEDTDPDLLRTNIMKQFIEAGLGQFQVAPAFLDRSGRLTATARFSYGTIKFFTVRDEDIESFLKEHSLIA